MTEHDSGAPRELHERDAGGRAGGSGGLILLSWNDPDPPGPASVERRLRAEGVEPYGWSNGPGDRYGRHAHGYTKLLMCAEGSITFHVGEDATPIELRAGEGLVLPAGTEHAAVVGPAGCTCLEGHRPTS